MALCFCKSRQPSGRDRYQTYLPFSCLNARNNDTTIKIIIMVNGKAAMIEAVCNDCKPPVQSKIAAITDWIIPHVNLTELAGFKLPFVVCIPRTNVAESADVTKNVQIRIIAIPANNEPNGKCWRTANSAISTPASFIIFIIFACSKRSKYSAVPPNTENQIILNTEWKRWQAFRRLLHTN